MAWIYQCVLYVTMFQMSVQGFGTMYARAPLRSERSANQKSNGSYKIINRYGKPFVNKRVPDGSVVFPGLTSRSGDDFTLQIPEECLELGICEQSSGYKDDLVESVIKDFQRRNKTFSSDVLEAPQIAERIGPDVDNIELCSSKEKLYVPNLVLDANEQKWIRVINSEKNPQQRFRVEICSKNNAPCSPIVIFQPGYEARCVQKHVLRHITVLNAQDEVIEKPFKVPSCCSCVARTV